MADHLKDTFVFGTSLGLALLCLMLLMMGCTAGPEPNPEGISVRGDVVTGPTGTCTVGSQPAEDLRSCGLTAAERERALSLLLAQQSVQQARSAANKPSRQELLWTARTLYVEAPPAGHPGVDYEMSLIANVIVHRQRSGNWASTIPGVVQSPKQFTGIHYDHRNVLSLTLEDYNNERLDKDVLHKWRRSVRVAEAALSAPDSLRPPKANAYANLSESGWKPWMRERHIVYRTPHHAYFRLPERRPPGPTAAAR